MMKIFETTMLLLGAIIGAGFATGAEIVTFFGQLALPAWLLALMVGVTMYLVIALTIKITVVQPPERQRWFNACLGFMYLILFTAMTAGVTQIGGLIGTICSLIAASCIVLFGFQQLSRINTGIVVVIMVALIVICGPHLTPSPITWQWTAIPRGWLQALLYAGLNGFILPEIIQAAAVHTKKRDLYWAGLITASMMALLVAFILTTINHTHTQNTVMPLLAAAHHPGTMMVILLAIFTSQYAALFALVQKIKIVIPQTHQHTGITVGIISVIAWFGSRFGFSKILQFGYPLIGIFTCCFLFFSWVRAWPVWHRQS